MKLTDDELAAFAVANGGSWRGQLATVDDSSVESLLESIRRGGASLVARELDPTEVGSGREMDTVRAMCGIEPVVYAYAAEGSTIDRPFALVAAIFPARDGEVLVDIATEGVHDLQVSRTSDAATFLQATCREAYETGFDEENLRFVVVDGSTRPASISIIARGLHESGQARPDEAGGFACVNTHPRPQLDESAIFDDQFIPASQ